MTAAHKSGMPVNTNRTAGLIPTGKGNITSFAPPVPNTEADPMNLPPEAPINLAMAFPDAVIMEPGQTVNDAATAKLTAVVARRFPGGGDRQLSVSRDHEGFATVDAVTDGAGQALWLEGEDDGAGGTFQAVAYELADMLDVGVSERRIITIPSTVGVTADRGLVSVGDADPSGDRQITLRQGGLITLAGRTDEFFHSDLYDTMTVEHAGTALVASLAIDGVNLTEIADADAITEHSHAITEVLAEMFGGAWLDDGWENDPESVRLNIPVHLGRDPFNGGEQTVGTNEILAVLDGSGVHTALENAFAYDGVEDVARAVREQVLTTAIAGARG